MLIAALLLFGLLGGYKAAAAGGESHDSGKNTVIWISLDGIRPDYLTRGEPPFILSLARQGNRIDRLQPPFPTLTFPSHVAMATGLEAAEHGIVSNTFYDRKSQRVHRYPWYGSLLQAEPIWITATRAGYPTAVFDWVLSHDQRGPHRAAYFGHRYVQGLSPRERLAPLVAAYKDSIDEGHPLRLLMGYLPEPDTSGHRFGPDSQEVIEALMEGDRVVAAAVDELRELWTSIANTGDRLIVLITSDHGMAKVEYLVHPEMLTTLGEREDLLLLTAGNMLQVYFREPVDDDEIHSLAEAIKHSIAPYLFANAYTREELPPHWNYNNPDRTADVLVVLDAPYSFSRRIEAVVVPTNGTLQPLGMHGYDATVCADMETIAVIATIAGKPGLPPIETTDPMPATRLKDIVLSLLAGCSDEARRPASRAPAPR